MSLCYRLWCDETAVIVSTEMVVIGTILVAGLTVGFSTLRNAVVTELADLAAAIGSLNQTYSYGGVVGHHSAVAGSLWVDQLDAGDTAGSLVEGVNSQGVMLCVLTLHEGDQP